MNYLARFVFGFLALAGLFLVPATAIAGGQRSFDAQAFKAAQAAGNPVLIEIHADWCPTCRAQQPILDKLSAEPEFSNIVRFRVDFDKQKGIVKQFGARYQSTLVLFKGKTEVARSTGETDGTAIRAMLKKAV